MYTSTHARTTRPNSGQQSAVRFENHMFDKRMVLMQITQYTPCTRTYTREHSMYARCAHARDLSRTHAHTRVHTRAHTHPYAHTHARARALIQACHVHIRRVSYAHGFCRHVAAGDVVLAPHRPVYNLTVDDHVRRRVREAVHIPTQYNTSTSTNTRTNDVR